MLTIRRERPADIPAIRLVEQAAFGSTEEADLVDALRGNCPELLSLVAVRDGAIVGHLLFSPVTLAGILGGMGLGPLAVHPDYQRRGIGTRLARRGLALMKRGGCPFVVVLGHARYYPRFGFQRALLYGVHSQWPDFPEEDFMLLLFDPSLAGSISGVCRYRVEFG